MATIKRLRLSGLILGMTAVTISGGCRHSGGIGSDRLISQPTPPLTNALVGTSLSDQVTELAGAAPALHRYIAVGHHLEIVAPNSSLEKSWQSLADYCGTLQCELVSSNINTQAEDSVPSGTISLRVAPEDESKLIAYVAKLGKISHHTTEREDKTGPVIDTEAKIKNLTGFRDNLRSMLAKPSATVKDLIEIQQQLTEVQSELDSENAQRKILANETEKVAMEFSLRSEKTFHGPGNLAQIGNVLRHSGEVLAESIASLITVVVAILPWLLVIAPTLWLFAKFWRKMRRNRVAVMSAPAL